MNGNDILMLFFGEIFKQGLGGVSPNINKVYILCW